MSLERFWKWIAELATNSKNVMAIVGVVTTFGLLYTQIGLPLPATTSYVDARIDSVTRRIDGIDVGVLETQLKTLRADRNNLRNERLSLQTTLNRPDLGVAESLAFQTRLEEINDLLRQIEQEEVDIRRRIRSGRDL